MMLDWNEYQKQLNGRIAEIAKLSTETVKVTRCFPALTPRPHIWAKKCAN